jgi:hypothetical protein
VELWKTIYPLGWFFFLRISTWLVASGQDVTVKEGLVAQRSGPSASNTGRCNRVFDENNRYEQLNGGI